jgi:hypothetical protein
VSEEKPDPNFVYREDASAPVNRGSADVISKIQRYICPQNKFPYIALWDLPGGGMVNLNLVEKEKCRKVKMSKKKWKNVENKMSKNIKIENKNVEG